MKYQSKIIFNPGSKPIEFFMAHPEPYTHYSWKPGEKKSVDGFVADYILKNLNSPLKEYDAESDTARSSDVDYYEMAWGELKKLGAERGVMKVGVSKDELIEKLVELDEQGA
jgi:hypothetical protein